MFCYLKVVGAILWEDIWASKCFFAVEQAQLIEQTEHTRLITSLYCKLNTNTIRNWIEFKLIKITKG